MATLPVLALIGLVRLCISALTALVIAYAVLSWVPGPGQSPFADVIERLVTPALAPIRRILPALGGLDLSVLVAFIALQAINYLLGDLFGQLWWMI